jgi:DnaK suppressor protein
MEKDSKSMAKRTATSRDRFLAKMYRYLTETKARLVQEAESAVRTAREGSRDECMDSCDLASEDNERELRTMLAERDRLKIGQIDDALGRIASLKYGLCETCGLEVVEERLNAMPFTRLCCDCQQERERESRTRPRYDESPYEGHTLSSIDAQEESSPDPLRSPGIRTNG